MSARIYRAIHDERARQERLRESGKFLDTCASPDFETLSHFARVTILGEKYGEVYRAMLDVEQAAEERDVPAMARAKLRTELIQVAAVAVAYIEALDQ